MTLLPLVEKSCGIAIEDALPAVIARRASAVQMEVFCRMYRRIGIAKLFVTGLPEGFFADLSRSARASAYFLEGKAESAKLTSLSEPWFDAVACNDVESVEMIARLSRPTWNEDEEYEEDFLYPWYLMNRFVLEPKPDALISLLGHWEKVLEGGEDPRLSLCRAFQGRDQKLFDETIELMIDDHQRENRRRIREGRMSPDDAPTLSKLWVELLALLQLAERLRLRTEAQYRFAPSIARRIELARLPAPDAWRRIESYRELT